MSVIETSRLKSEEIKPKIGSRILNSKEELLSGELTDQINDLLEQRGVLVFKKINFTDEEQIAFTHTLGTFAHEEGESIFSKNGEDSVYPITMDPKVNPNADYLKGKSVGLVSPARANHAGS